jgi:hypothetical protein
VPIGFLFASIHARRRTIIASATYKLWVNKGGIQMKGVGKVEA